MMIDYTAPLIALYSFLFWIGIVILVGVAAISIIGHFWLRKKDD